MRCLILTLASLLLASSIIADPPHTSVAPCFERLLRKIPLNRTIAVITTAGDSILGTMPTVVASSLYLSPVAGIGSQRGESIPLNEIQRIVYTRPSPARLGVICLATGIGAVVGRELGMRIDNKSRDFFSLRESKSGIIGTALGGIVGAVVGTMIGKRLNTTVILTCR